MAVESNLGVRYLSLGYLAIAIIVLIVLGRLLLFDVVLVDRLTLHNATASPIVFSGAAGPVGQEEAVDIYVPPCRTAEFEWETIGWSTADADAFEPQAGAVPVAMTIEPPFDGLAGARYTAVVTAAGLHELRDGEPVPDCSD